MQESQRLGVIEGADLGHEAREEIQGAIAFGDEAGQRSMPVAAPKRTGVRIGPLDQRTAGCLGIVRRGQPGQRKMVAAFIMLAFAEEGGAAFLVDQPGRGVRKVAVGVGRCLATLGLEE